MFVKVLATALIAAYAAARDTTGDGKRTFQELAVKNGFGFEQHTVTTEDGYILTVWRIPGLAGEAKKLGKPTVLLQHGVLDSANCWAMHYPEVAPAFVAARAGYDVWLGNNRGTVYSDGTVEGFDKTTAEYYDYSFYELGKYDAPTQIDFVLEKTG